MKAFRSLPQDTINYFRVISIFKLTAPSMTVGREPSSVLIPHITFLSRPRPTADCPLAACKLPTAIDSSDRHYKAKPFPHSEA